ncbi:MAG: helicase-exonuclease AddAB subunit AddA [Clostridia bacterium]|nr:helicase-exonuclease AddAB subunit AddA [Clostridia bacterium]
MAERVWTPGQSKAINMRDGDLIISAAAGSGKTAVLCERVIRSLLDENDPINISEMLIVTFTKASAEELKERIAKAINGEIAKNPDSRRLVRQLMMLQNADIGTIHSFCGDLISANTAALSLPSSVRVADASESDIIALKTMEKCIDDSYALDDEFPYMVRNFTAAGDSDLASTLLSIYKKTQNDPKGIALLSDFAREYYSMDKDLWRDSRYAKQICNSLCSELRSYISSLKEGIEYIKNDEKVFKARGVAYLYDVDYMEKICEAAAKGWDEFVKALDNEYLPPKCGSVRGVTDSRIEDIKEERDAIREKLKKLRGEYLWDTNEILKVCEINAKFLSTLYRTLSAFEKRFSEEKLRLSIIDFTDLEKMAYKLLVKSDGSPTELASEISKKYRQIYIDEYQDTNALQDGIFKAVSRDNRFMVGDIKQSIYGFRGAEPSIFASYRDSFSDCMSEDSPATENGKRIFLSNNFRCDKTIIDFSNSVFEMLFRNNSGKIEYLDEDALVFSKDSKEKYDNVEILLTEKDGDCPGYAEALTVAKEIKDLIASGVQPSDIAVMMRSFGENARVLKKVFESEGIPMDASSVDLFSTPEILLILSLLNCIDNPHRDIWLAGALSSKIFGIEFSDIVDIASEKYETRMSLYDKFRAYTRENNFTKGERFLTWLADSRERASGKKVFEIIDDICRDFAINALASINKDSAENAKKCIELFKNLARGYEKSAFRGLHSFLGYIEDLRNGKAGADALKVEASENNDTVKLLTIHHSKGLEFEYCFVSGCGKSVNKSDIRSNFLFANSFGAVIRPIDLGGKVRYNSPMYKAMVEYIYEMQIDEEMRVLYVALTRARKKLYVTAEIKGVDQTLAKAEQMRNNCSPYVFRASSTYIHWILAAVYKKANDVDVFKVLTPSYYDWKSGVSQISSEKLGEAAASGELPEAILEEEIAADEDSACEDRPLLGVNEIRKRLEYSYPFEKELTLPAKMSVSRLFPEVLDTDYADLVKSEEKITDIPSFMSEGEDIKVTGAMRGTATHVFMQFCDFENAEKNGVETELARLCDKKFINPSLARLVYIDKLKKFFSSELYREIKSAKSIWREKRFSLMLPASEFTGREELKEKLSGTKLLVQGVFDCLIERDDKTLKLIDYKTDYVSGNIEEDEKMLRERYFTQLSYYKRACELMMGRTVSETVVYSFGLGREVRII